MPAGPPPITSTCFFSCATGILSSFSSSRDGLTVHATRFPNMMPFRQRRHPMQGRISSSLPSQAFCTNSGSQRFARPIMQISAFPFAINSSANHGSVMRPTVAIGIDTCFLISSPTLLWDPIGVPGAGIELPRIIVVPPDTWMKSTPAFSNCFAT